MRPRTDVMPKLGPMVGLFKSRALDHSAKLTVLLFSGLGKLNGAYRMWHMNDSVHE